MSAERIGPSEVMFNVDQIYSRSDFIFRASALSLVNPPIVATKLGHWVESADRLPEDAMIIFSEVGDVVFPVTTDGDFFTNRAIS